MLQDVPADVKECLERGAAARRKAEEASSPDTQEFWRQMENRWLGLARSYEQVARTDRLVRHIEPPKRGTD
jgi:hypothetical protein